MRETDKESERQRRVGGDIDLYCWCELINFIILVHLIVIAYFLKRKILDNRQLSVFEKKREPQLKTTWPRKSKKERSNLVADK